MELRVRDPKIKSCRLLSIPFHSGMSDNCLNVTLVQFYRRFARLDCSLHNTITISNKMEISHLTLLIRDLKHVAGALVTHAIILSWKPSEALPLLLLNIKILQMTKYGEYEHQNQLNFKM